jgi:poly-gamma-glutamate capsule biosynthesis protein CapA/YwtB (metallophosphatase superfamily)
MTRIAVLGDTMLGRLCADRAATADAADLLGERVRAALGAADLVVANLECCISARGRRWPAPGKPYFFRAPPAAAGLLASLGVDVVTLANNHALDYGRDALLDTLEHLAGAGVRTVGAGPTRAAARRPLTVEVGGTKVTIIAVADHPADYAAGVGTPGTAYADLSRGLPAWLQRSTVEAAQTSDVVLVTPHWGPNMTTAPVPHVRAAAAGLAAAGATVIAGHSAHVFHGVSWEQGTCILWDLGDFVDDYAVDPRLRNDLGLLWTIELDGAEPRAVEALPLRLQTCRTDAAAGDDAEWIGRRLARACESLGTSLERRPATGTLRCSR